MDIQEAIRMPKIERDNIMDTIITHTLFCNDLAILWAHNVEEQIIDDNGAVRENLKNIFKFGFKRKFSVFMKEIRDYEDRVNEGFRDMRGIYLANIYDDFQEYIEPYIKTLEYSIMRFLMKNKVRDYVFLTKWEMLNSFLAIAVSNLRIRCEELGKYSDAYTKMIKTKTNLSEANKMYRCADAQINVGGKTLRIADDSDCSRAFNILIIKMNNFEEFVKCRVNSYENIKAEE